MSLARFVLRTLVRKALIGRTLAGDEVRDSDLTDMEQMIKDTPVPVIVIYTDDQIRSFDGAKDLFSAKGHVLLVIQLSISGPTTATINGEQQVSFGFLETSEGLEMQIDFMERQIIVALTDPANPWSQLFVDFVTGFHKSQSLRGASAREGARYAARQISLETETRFDPVPGRAASGFWARLIAAITADPDPDFAAIAPVLKAMIEGPAESDLSYIMRDLAITAQTAEDIGEAPIDGATVQGSEIIIDPLGVSTSNTSAIGNRS